MGGAASGSCDTDGLAYSVYSRYHLAIYRKRSLAPALFKKKKSQTVQGYQVNEAINSDAFGFYTPFKRESMDSLYGNVK